jgi:uncharacterized protein YbcI
MVNAQAVESIRAALAKRHKHTVGRGPQRVSLDIRGNVATLVFEGFLSPLEQLVLQDKANHDLVLEFRNRALRNDLPEFDAILSQVGLRVAGVEGDLDCERERRVIRLRLEEI